MSPESGFQIAPNWLQIGKSTNVSKMILNPEKCQGYRFYLL